MTSFNVESQFLDLKKTYQNFQYQQLQVEGIVKDQLLNSKDIYQGMTQNTYLFVQQKTVLIKDIQNIANYFSHKYCSFNNKIRQSAFKQFPFEKVKDRVCFIFQKYQQQPTLLDTLLENLIKPIMDVIKVYLAKLNIEKQQFQKPTQQLHAITMIIYQLTKVRGKKWVIQYFPHQVKDLYPVLGYLARQKNDVSTNWETRYIVLLWLGVIALVPFNLDIIDSGVIKIQKQQGGEVSEIVQVMIQIGKHYLKSLTKMREAAALFIGKLFTRPDIQKRSLLPQYIKYVINKLNMIKNSAMDIFFVCGLYHSLYHIFKRVQRKQLLPLIGMVLSQLKYQKQNVKDNGTKKQLKMKLLTQIGLTYLKPRSVNWAYYRKTQSLDKNLSITAKTTIKTNTGQLNQSKKSEGSQVKNFNNQTSSNDLQYYQDVDKLNLEDIIDMLVDGLMQKQTTVREDAAKGIGKIAGRLSQDMVLDIIDYILNLTPSPQVQHAICLTIAELIRRNLISPQKLVQIYPLMKDSLIYQQQQGGYSIGQAVRDAACYMTWSVARAYAQGGHQLGISLMIAACFDRQVGCRRAASAAYQQLVGRVGDVPNGIQILTEADYFTLGLQKNAYLNVAIFVASYPSYFKPFVEHLCYQKLRHWDLQIKRISACSLSLMCSLNPIFLGKQVLPSLLQYLDFDSMNVKLGSIIGIGQIMLGLSGLSHQHQLIGEMKDSVFLKSLTQNEKKLLKAGQYMENFKQHYQANRYQNYFSVVDQQVIDNIAINIANKITQGKIYKGKAGQNFRIYTCRLLQCFAICQVQLSQSHIQIFTDFIQQNIKNPLEHILNSAVKSLKPFLKQYHDLKRDQKIVKNLLQHSKNAATGKCFTLALSKLTKQIYEYHFQDVLTVLQQNCSITKQNNDPQKRKYAILGLVQIVREVGFGMYMKDKIEKIFCILFKTVEDYTMDKRGDIGSIVREASMTAMIQILKFYIDYKGSKQCIITNQIVAQIISSLLQQISQKIDRIRLLAGSLLQQFFDTMSHQFQIPQQQILFKIFCQQNIKKLIKQSQQKMDQNLQTQVMKMEMKIQQTIFHQEERYLIYFWNLPHAVFPLIVPLIQIPRYSYYILKGLCTSTGGISESIIKHSLQQLGNEISKISQTNIQVMQNFFQDVIKLMKNHFRDERIIVPLYKTLDFILERQQIIQWKGIKTFDTQMFYLLQKQIGKLKNIVKVSASTGIYVNLLSLNNQQTKKGILVTIVKILCSDLPKARKMLADKLLFFLMSQDQFTIFGQSQSQELMNVLSQNDFLDEKLDVQTIKVQLNSLLLLN